MTTYSITGIKLSNYVNDVPTEIASTELKVVMADANTGFSYQIVASTPGSFSEIEMTSPEPYNVTFDGVLGADLFNSSFDTVLTGYMTWPAGTAYLLDFYSDNQAADYVFQMGGDALPVMNTPADVSTFLQSVTGTGGIASGPYGPGQVLPLADFANVQVTERDVFSGTDLDDIYSTGLGNDVVRAGLGDDTVSGNQGRDKLWGQGGNDKLSGGAGNDVLNGGLGQDELLGGNSHDRLFGNDGKDALFGNNGNDKLSGGSGRDRLFGGGGNDELIGGNGNDFMRGGAGSDVFVYKTTIKEGSDVISDFTVGTDLVRIGGGITFADVVIVQIEKGTLASWGETSVLFKGVAEADLTVDSFDFI
jgi:Ca2+-binding RTX toxin-like protein